MPRKKKQEVHGELASPRGVYEIAGLKTHVFKHKTKEEYEKWLDSTPLTDLQNHAIEAGLVPVDNREMMKERLLREYCKETGKNPSIASQPRPPSEKSKSRIEELLKRGR